MHRPTLMAAACALVFAGCAGQAAERQLLLDFFRLSQLADRSRLAAIATTAVNPRSDGVVGAFAIVTESAEERQPLTASASDTARQAAAISLTLPNDIPLDPIGFELVSKRMSLDAEVRTPDGRTVRREVTVMLQRAVQTVTPREGRWIVVDVRM
jgi:hypothetical protein